MYVEVKSAVDALNRLKPREKQVLRMAIYEGMSHNEIAQAVGLPLGTVKSRVRQGLQKIRSSIKLQEQI
jgi:RNA polymerase sigma-70 factor (ECF subfamily)